jgi:hypothetical protein
VRKYQLHIGGKQNEGRRGIEKKDEGRGGEKIIKEKERGEEHGLLVIELSHH